MLPHAERFILPVEELVSGLCQLIMKFSLFDFHSVDARLKDWTVLLPSTRTDASSVKHKILNDIISLPPRVNRCITS